MSGSTRHIEEARAIRAVHSATASRLVAAPGKTAAGIVRKTREKTRYGVDVGGPPSPWHASRNSGESISQSHELAMTMPLLQARESDNSCCLLVMESGSRWPSWLDAPPESRIVAQNVDESPAEFASRVARSIRAIGRAGKRLEQVVIAAGWVNDEEQALFARSLITQAAARAMDSSGGAVALSGHDGLPESSRHELFATAGALAQQLAGSPIDVRVRFDTVRTEPTSGIYGPEMPILDDSFELGSVMLAEPVLATS